MLDCTSFNNGEQCILAWKCWPAIYVVKEVRDLNASSGSKSQGGGLSI